MDQFSGINFIIISKQCCLFSSRIVLFTVNLFLGVQFNSMIVDSSNSVQEQFLLARPFAKLFALIASMEIWSNIDCTFFFL